MVDPTDVPRPGESPDLARVFAELQNLLLDSPAVTDFLDQVAAQSVALVAGSSCGITMRQDHQVVTAAHSDDFAMLLDNLQYGSGQGPCLQALNTGRRVDVPDLAVEPRWPQYRDGALAHGVRSSVSLPLDVRGDTFGALNLYNARPYSFPEDAVTTLEAYAQQAATALALLLRQAHHEVVQGEMLDGVATRALIDQAIGILMAQRRVTASEALAVLREQSQNSNRKVSSLAAELIRATTGRDPEPPRPFTLSGSGPR